MGTLVICPTCGGKMSSSAWRCPHCAETSFVETIYTNKYNRCGRCDGTGGEYGGLPGGVCGYKTCTACGGSGKLKITETFDRRRRA